MADIFGITGLFLISAGWLVELWGIFKRKKSQVPFNFALLYGAGSAFLTLHSLILSDNVFIVLNGFATIIALLNICLHVVQWKLVEKAIDSGARFFKRHV